MTDEEVRLRIKDEVDRGILDYIPLLEEIKPIIDYVDNYRDDFYSNMVSGEGLTSFKIEDSFNIVYKFLEENYPDIAYLYLNDIKECSLYLLSNEEQGNINRLVYERALYYMEKIDKSNTNYKDILFQSLKDELSTSGLNPMYWTNALASLEEFIYFNNSFSFISNDYVSHFYRAEDYRYIMIENCNNFTVMGSILHEFIHSNNCNYIWRDGEGTFETAFLLLSEMPSVCIELEFLEWLYKKGYINSNDYKYAFSERLAVSFKTIDHLKIMYNLLKEIDEGREIDDSIKKIIDNDLLVSVDILSELLDCNLSIFFSASIIQRNKMSDSYREKFVDVNNNIVTREYYDTLKYLNLDYRDSNVLEELKDNFRLFYDGYALDMIGKMKR